MDDPRYKTGMTTCLNAYPVEEGAWTRRSGTRHLAPSRNGMTGKLLPFNFSENTPYNIEVTAGHIRAFTGDELVTDNLPVVVSSISAATPAVVTLASAATWVSGDQAQFTFGSAASALALAHLSNRQFDLVKLTTQAFALFDPETGVPVDGAQIGWTGGMLASLTKVFDLANSYTVSQVPDVRGVQSDLTQLLLHHSVKPKALTVSTQPATDQFAQFAIDDASFVDGPYLDPVNGSTAAPTAVRGSIGITLGLKAYVATHAYVKGDFVSNAGIGYRSLIDANVGNTPASSPTAWVVASPGEVVGPNGIVATDVGRLVRLYNATPAATYNAATTYVIGDFVTHNSIGYRSLASGNLAKTPNVSPTWWEVAAPGWTWGKITGLSSSGLVGTGTAFGNMTSGGGNSAAFDGVVTKPQSTSALFSSGQSGSVPYASFGAYVGRAYSSAQAVSYAVVTPSSDGLARFTGGGASQIVVNSVVLRGKNTAPASSGDGVALATYTGGNTSSPITLNSSDTVTPYLYLWIEASISTFLASGVDATVTVGIAQAQFYNSSAPPGTSFTMQLIGPQLPDTSTITSWRIGAYSDTTGWPTCGCYHEGRFWLAGAIPNRFDSTISNTGATFNFAPTNAAGVVGDANAISGTFNSSDINTIFWMMPDLQGIVCGTQAGEWLLQASAANNPLTPASIQAHRVTKYGCANVEPKRTGLTTMFVQKFGRRLHEYLSDIFSGRFFSPNTTERAKHLTKSNILEIAYQEELTPIVWSRLGNGTLAGTTYRRVAMSSASEPVFNGWHRHTLGSGRKVESIVSGPSVDGNLDSISMMTNDAETGVRHIEVMETMFDEDDVITSAWFLDNAVTPSAAQSITISGAPALRLFGLWHLNGKTVTAWVGALDCGDFVVANGYIDVPYSSNALLTKAYLTKLSTSGEDFGNRAVLVDAGMLTIPAVVGFTYTSRGQVLRPNDPEKTGARQGPAFGKVRRGHKYAALFHNAQGVSVGTSFTKMDPVQFKSPGGDRLAANVLFSGMHKDTLTDASSEMDSNLAWEISRPYPATIAAIGEFLSTQDE